MENVHLIQHFMNSKYLLVYSISVKMAQSIQVRSNLLVYTISVKWHSLFKYSQTCWFTLFLLKWNSLFKYSQTCLIRPLWWEDNLLKGHIVTLNLSQEATCLIRPSYIKSSDHLKSLTFILALWTLEVTWNFV